MSSVEEHRRYAPARLSFAVLTASDSRDESEDESGALIVREISAAGHVVVARQIVPDEAARIRAAVTAAIEQQQADVVVVSGGTGFSPRDVSVEAILPLVDREVEGFGELFRSLSFEQIGAAAMLSRAMAGVIGTSAVFVLPGSPRGVELAMLELVLPEAGHLVGQIRR